jgi:hypothetical protein
MTYYYTISSIFSGDNYSYILTDTAIVHANLPTCPGIPTITVDHHIVNGVAPVEKSVTYGTVTNIPGSSLKCWITKNLGADKTADSVNDASENSAGWYWQFNRKQGFKHDGITRTPNIAWETVNLDGTDWEIENDPCSLEFGGSWHIPTYTEMSNAYFQGYWYSGYNHWHSALKLHFAGHLAYNSGALNFRGTRGFVWTTTNISTENGAWCLDMDLRNSTLEAYFYTRVYGYSVRCIRDNPTLATVTTTPPTNIEGFAASSGGNVANDGGLPVTSRGVCWSTSPAPTIAGSHTTDGAGTGEFVSNLTGLSPLTFYYVRAYAVNNVGIAYGNEVTFTTDWGCGLTMTVNHLSTGPVAPVNKTVTYGTVTNIPGEP